MLILRRALLPLTALLLLAVTGPAYARPESSRDTAKDVVSRGQFSDGPLKTREPARKLGDILRTDVTLGSDLVITTKMRSLAAIGHQEWHWTVVTSTDEDPGGWTGSLAYNGDKRGDLTFIDPIANDPGCATSSIDRTAKTVTLTVPASCLGNPAWVRVGNGTLTLAGGKEYQDDARRASTISLAKGYQLGPRVTVAE